MNPTVFPPLNAERLNARVEQLARFTRADVPWTRRAFSPLFTEGKRAPGSPRSSPQPGSRYRWTPPAT
ncbi:allantoate amidohydrolase [Burkholderia pseudomallei]|nr:allantoate amidohydrolase [Burkholderia pseudomallei]